MGKDHKQEIQSIANEVFEYLENYPDSVDSIEGITTWWLTRQRYESALRDVQRALDILVENGKVVKFQNADDRTVYTLKLK